MDVRVSDELLVGMLNKKVFEGILLVKMNALRFILVTGVGSLCYIY